MKKLPSCTLVTTALFQVSLSRVAAFTKRLCQLCLIMADPECAASLVAIRTFFIVSRPFICGLLIIRLRRLFRQ